MNNFILHKIIFKIIYTMIGLNIELLYMVGQLAVLSQKEVSPILVKIMLLYGFLCCFTNILIIRYPSVA